MSELQNNAQIIVNSKLREKLTHCKTYSQAIELLGHLLTNREPSFEELKKLLTEKEFLANNGRQAYVDRLSELEDQILKIKTRYPKKDLTLLEVQKAINSCHTEGDFKDATTTYQSIQAAVKELKRKRHHLHLLIFWVIGYTLKLRVGRFLTLHW